MSPVIKAVDEGGKVALNDNLKSIDIFLDVYVWRSLVYELELGTSRVLSV
ncbi:hypothetical protein RNAN_1522 [Rheinheimera nanhaiensis E407-8]|uniref:Uncharacterized protein n=1 Tax=Rheinheimera nanhaiensis E407-8 TaxID=562729 RepID=I1DWX1_9GAMM|nr:hypothetical protein RNAN_1522 [Rheinheimera nanhaiensis E407-8]